MAAGVRGRRLRLGAACALVAMLEYCLFQATSWAAPQTGAASGLRRGHTVMRATSVAPAVVETSGALKLASSGMGLLKSMFNAEAQLQAGDYDREAIRQALIEETTSAPVVIYTYSLSPFCTEATRLLDSLNATYKEIVLAPEWFMMLGTGAAKRAELARSFGRSSMPHIFFGGRSIGGLTEGNPGLLPLYEAGALEDALKQVGALPEDNLFGFFTFSGENRKQKCYGDDFCEEEE